MRGEVHILVYCPIDTLQWGLTHSALDHLTYSHNRLINIPQYGESVADGLAMLRIHNYCTNRDVDVGMLRCWCWDVGIFIGMLMSECWAVGMLMLRIHNHCTDRDVDVGILMLGCWYWDIGMLIGMLMLGCWCWWFTTTALNRIQSCNFISKYRTKTDHV